MKKLKWTETCFSSCYCSCNLSASQIQLWCWQCVPYKCLYYLYYYYYYFKRDWL